MKSRADTHAYGLVAAAVLFLGCGIPMLIGVEGTALFINSFRGLPAIRFSTEKGQASLYLGIESNAPITDSLSDSFNNWARSVDNYAHIKNIPLDCYTVSGGKRIWGFKRKMGVECNVSLP